jgi:hypothetical protein
MKYIDVCKALYDYEAGSEDELSFKEDDILYILERDDDDWWKAQLKFQQPDEVGPIGLIPANYASEVMLRSPQSSIHINFSAHLLNLLCRPRLLVLFLRSMTMTLNRKRKSVLKKAIL